MKPMRLPAWVWAHTHARTPTHMCGSDSSDYRSRKAPLLSMFASVAMILALSIVAIAAIAGCNPREPEQSDANASASASASANIKVPNTAEAVVTPTSVPGASGTQSNVSADIESTTEGISTATSTSPAHPSTASATASVVVIAAATEAAITIPCDAVVVPTRPATIVAAHAPQDKIAPSYWEIRRTVECIMITHPMTPSKHTEKPEQFYAYKFHLMGMRVEGWQGWINDNAFTEDTPENTYHIRVYMVIPQLGELSSYYPSNLYSLTEKEVTKLKQWQASRPNVQWHRVSFSGTIMSIGSDGQVFISKAKMTPIDE